jgi:ion channel-forming bestrophin family protein
MHVGRSYRIPEFLVWTRKDVYVLLVLGFLPVFLYQTVGLKWLAIPWTAVALLGTATAFIVGFKNVQTYNRTWEARQIWGDVVGYSRAWGTMSTDFVKSPDKTRTLIYRHLAWLTALRYHLRESRAWETVSKPHNTEYRRLYSIPEQETALEVELAKYLPGDELQHILSTRSRATQIAALQSKTIKELYANQEILVLQFVDMQRAAKEFQLHQARSERIKDFPFPRQFATVSALFVRLFCFLLPFGLLREFDELNESVAGLMKGHMAWLVIPFSVLISWIYTSLEQVGESTENPFEGRCQRRADLTNVPQRRDRFTRDPWRIGSAGPPATPKQYRPLNPLT